MANTRLEVTNDLVTRACEGDAQAVEEIVRALERPIYNVALRMLLDRQDAEDAAQESLVRIVTHLGQFRGEARFSTWAWSIAVRRILDFREQRAAAARFTFADFAADLSDGLEEDAVERADDAILHQQLKMVCSRAMLQCLDGDHRIAFILGEILELSSTDAAEILLVDAATFRKRLSRARTALAAFLNRNCGVMNSAAPCACHRRLSCAIRRGRVDRSETDGPDGDLVALRTHLSQLSEAQRLAAFYRSEPDRGSSRDFVAAIRSLLSQAHPMKEPS
jgi:RNA polymerase sigma factor (sigma-70 family)